jgi:hypothetical protein
MIIEGVAVLSIGFDDVEFDVRHVQVPGKDDSEVYS